MRLHFKKLVYLVVLAGFSLSHAGSFEDFTIDKTWVYILGLAFGSKAIQKFGEDNTGNSGGGGTGGGNAGGGNAGGGQGGGNAGQ